MGDGLILQRARRALSRIIADHRLGREAVRVAVEPLSPEQAIGRPCRPGFALAEGQEVMVEAEFRGTFGQAFTDHPRSFEGTIEDVQHLALDTNDNRAVFISTLNAVASHLGMIEGTQHCRDDDPERCGSEIASRLLRDFGEVRIGLVGFQPALLAHLAEHFGANNIRCTDLNRRNIGSRRYGVDIDDGRTATGHVVNWSDLLLVTGSAIVNNTFDDISEAAASGEKALLVFGVTGAGTAALLGLKRVCPFAR